MKLMNFLAIMLLSIFSINMSAQKESDLDRLYWSDKERISIDDFGVKSTNAKAGLSSASFSFEYNVHGLSYFVKNFNNKVNHYMVRSASQINLDGNEEQYIRYQQTLFDIEEIYVRQFRKELQANRKKFFLRRSFADELKDKIIGEDLLYRQTQYNNETNQGKDAEKQQEWEEIIRKELDALSDYAL